MARAGLASGEIYFNPLEWQFLFVIGCRHAYEGSSRLEPILHSRGLLVLAIAYLIFSLTIALGWTFESLEVVPEIVTNLCRSIGAAPSSR